MIWIFDKRAAKAQGRKVINQSLLVHRGHSFFMDNPAVKQTSGLGHWTLDTDRCWEPTVGHCQKLCPLALSYLWSRCTGGWPVANSSSSSSGHFWVTWDHPAGTLADLAQAALAKNTRSLITDPGKTGPQPISYVDQLLICLLISVERKENHGGNVFFGGWIYISLLL